MSLLVAVNKSFVQSTKFTRNLINNCSLECSQGVGVVVLHIIILRHVDHNKHVGLDLSGSNQEAYLAYYKAYKLFHDKLNDPRNLASFTLRSGPWG